MLTRMIRELFEPLIEMILWISLVVALVGGWKANRLLGSLFALLIWLLTSVLFIGLALIIVDIRNAVKRIEDSRSQAGLRYDEKIANSQSQAELRDNDEQSGRWGSKIADRKKRL